MKPLSIIPTYLREGQDLSVLETAIQTFTDTTAGGSDLLVVDDGSPAEDLVKGARALTESRGWEFFAKERNEGFARTVNVGLRRALNEDRDAILINADVEFTNDFWLDRMVASVDDEGRPAAIVGALLLYPNGTIQHAGIYFSLLYREFDHIYHYGPGNLREAQAPRVCPVTGALQFIRHSTLEKIGVYDETFRLGWEDVDFCVRAWQEGLKAVYDPGVTAIHHESFFRNSARASPQMARWQNESWGRFAQKWGTTSFAAFVPSVF